jgi:cytochrome c-type biogenesis protein
LDVETLGLAVAAGMVATVNPCGFAMLPAYLTLVVAGERGEHNRATAIWRAFGATGAMLLGFLVVFGLFGLVITPLASSIMQYMPVVTVVIGVAMLALGGWMLAGKEITLLIPKPRRGAPTARLGSMIGYGLAYAIVSLSCTIGPFLAVTSSTFRSGEIIEGIANYLAYGLGMGLVVGVLAIAVAVASSTVASGARKILPYVHRIGGVLVIIVGLYVGYYGIYELRLFHGDGVPDDAVVAGAGALQSIVSDLVDGIGPLPLTIVILAMLGIGVLLSWLARRRAGTRRQTESAESTGLTKSSEVAP